MTVSELTSSRIVLKDSWRSILWTIPAGLFCLTVGVLGITAPDWNRMVALFMLFVGCACLGALGLHGTTTLDAKSRSLVITSLFGLRTRREDLSEFYGASVIGFAGGKESILPLFSLNLHWEGLSQPEAISCITQEKDLDQFSELIWFALQVNQMFGTSLQFSGVTDHLPVWFAKQLDETITRTGQQPAAQVQSEAVPSD